jgi:hypothetical protein
MNIAFATAIIFILLIPGILFRRFYFSGEFSKQFFKSTAFELFASTSIPSILLHVIWIAGVSRFTSVSVDISTIFTLLSGQSEKNEIFKCFKEIEEDYPKIVAYNLSIWLSAIVLGLILKFLVRKLKLDRNYSLFRYNNEWHYFLTGEILDFPKVPGKYKDIKLRYLNILVSTEEGEIIYTGLLAHYFLSKDGGLESIYLSKAKRRYLKDEGESRKSYYEMPGEFLFIPFENILNINITYYNFEIAQSSLPTPTNVAQGSN